MSPNAVRGFQAAIDNIHEIRVGWGESSRWIVGVGASYGAYVEFGTSRMQAQPYLFPAARFVMRTQFPVIVQQARSADDLVAKLALAIEREAKQRAPVETGNLRGSIKAYDKKEGREPWVDHQ